jgi:hypothetical protein
VGSLIAGVVFAIGAWFSLWYKGTDTDAGAAAETTDAGVTPAR